MPISLPEAIGGYFTADHDGSNNIAQCFTDNAIVKDENRTYEGQAAISQWKSEVSKKFTYRSEPFACEEKDGKTIVTSRLTGSFPGSPVELRYIFRMEGDRIASLEITP